MPTHNPFFSIFATTYFNYRAKQLLICLYSDTRLHPYYVTERAELYSAERKADSVRPGFQEWNVYPAKGLGELKDDGRTFIPTGNPDECNESGAVGRSEQ